MKYYYRRLLQEEIAGRNATCEAARLRHEELASAYRHRSRLIVSLSMLRRDVAVDEKLEHEIA